MTSPIEVVDSTVVVSGSVVVGGTVVVSRTVVVDGTVVVSAKDICRIKRKKFRLKIEIYQMEKFDLENSSTTFSI